jgi:soluble lytic murein transglycosylase-like protein
MLLIAQIATLRLAFLPLITCAEVPPVLSAVPGNPLCIAAPLPMSRAIEADHVLKRLVPKRYTLLVRRAAISSGVDAGLLASLLAQESDHTWSASLVSRKNRNGTVDIGIAQVNSAYLSYYRMRYGLTDPKDANQSFVFCARYLRDLYDETGSWFASVCAYKGGLRGMGIPRVQNDARYVVRMAGL